MTRIVVHAGFHKTGTTSVQTTIRMNRAVLDSHLRVYLKSDFAQLADAARAFSIKPEKDSGQEFHTEARAFLDGIDLDDPRPMLLCCEDLAGHMPGRRGLKRYGATPFLMAALADAVLERFGEHADLIFYFSTRASAQWMRSAWWQTLCSTRLTLDYATFSNSLPVAGDLGAIVTDVAQAVFPIEVTSESLETSGERRLGPVSPLLDLFDLDPEAIEQMRVAPPANVQPNLGLDAVYLALNRSGLSGQDLRQTKRHLRKIVNKNPNTH